ncbi:MULTISPECIES: hypothetical protein [Bacillus]|uniref:hypothetical protein n=1 Tax=Bacillus TaxID=1386 RepID=UPI002E192F70|nr:hypothetical protein [Bacillus thuringiensis]
MFKVELIFKSKKYEREIKEIKKLRDMLRYDTDTDNPQKIFYGYYQGNLEYIEEVLCKAYEGIVPPIRGAIQDSIYMDKKHGYSLVKMLYLR